MNNPQWEVQPCSSKEIASVQRPRIIFGKIKICKAVSPCWHNMVQVRPLSVGQISHSPFDETEKLQLHPNKVTIKGMVIYFHPVWIWKHTKIRFSKPRKLHRNTQQKDFAAMLPGVPASSQDKKYKRTVTVQSRTGYACKNNGHRGRQNVRHKTQDFCKLCPTQRKARVSLQLKFSWNLYIIQREKLDWKSTFNPVVIFLLQIPI